MRRPGHARLRCLSPEVVTDQRSAQLWQDLSRASGLPTVCFEVRDISPGSVLAKVGLE